MPSYTQSVFADRPVYLQTHSYSAKDDRKPLADLITAGVVGAGDFLATLTSGMGISVAAGVAYVPGLNVADQGLYRQYSSGAITMVVTASDPTNPRIDQVILRVLDGDSDTSGAYEGRIEIVPGTPTAGATLVNRNGHKDLTALLENSKSVLWLADILVPATAVALVGGNLVDKRVRAAIGGNIPLTIESDLASAATILLHGTHSGRPAADSTNLNYYYFETDTLQLFQNQSSAWVQLTGNSGSGHFLGEPIEWISLTLPTYGSEVWGWEDGSAVSRTTYAGLLAVMTKAQNGARTSGSPIITALGSTAGLAAGMAVEGTGLPDTTIFSVDSSSQITLSNNATSSGTNTVTVFPYGNGNGSTTFNLRDMRGRTSVGLALSSGHADVSGMGLNDGVAVANRRPKHQTSSANFTVTGAPALGSLVVTGAPDVGSLSIPQSITTDTGGSDHSADRDRFTGVQATIAGAPGIGSLAVGGAPAVGSLDVGGSGGPSGTAAIDTPAYMVAGMAVRML